MSFMRAAELAKQAVEEGYAGERSVSIVRVPRWVSDPAVWLATKVTGQKTHGPAHFISEASKHDMSAPNLGTRRLLDHYREKVGERKREEEEEAARSLPREGGGTEK